MKPGASTSPLRSMTSSTASALASTSPTASTNPSTTSTSARTPGAPVPSTTVAPRSNNFINASRPGSCDLAASAVDHQRVARQIAHAGPEEGCDDGSDIGVRGADPAQRDTRLDALFHRRVQDEGLVHCGG